MYQCLNHVGILKKETSVWPPKGDKICCLKQTQTSGWCYECTSCFLSLTGEWKREKKNCRSLSQSYPKYQDWRKQPPCRGEGCFRKGVTIRLLEDIWIQLLFCALCSISAFFMMDPGYPRCRDQLSRKLPVGADLALTGGGSRSSWSPDRFGRTCFPLPLPSCCGAVAESLSSSHGLFYYSLTSF